MLPTKSIGWIGFQALKVRLEGRLAVFTSRKADAGRPTKFQNDADLLDCDLRDIFKTATLDINLSDDDFDDLNQKANDFLTSLNDMVNEDVLHSWEAPINLSSHDITKIDSVYPKLAALMLFLDASSYRQFNLVSDPDSSLFLLPHGEIGIKVAGQAVAWKAVLQRLVARSDKSQSWHDVSQPKMHMDVLKPTECQPSVVQNPVGIVMDTILKEFQEVECGTIHEVKLRVLEETYTNSYRPKLEMLMSCCQPECEWQEAVCDSIK